MPAAPPADEAPATAARELRAIRVAVVCAALGAVLKLTTGIAAGSMAMISSAVDSLGDILVSLVNLVVIRVSDAPPDDDHNYGHAKIEGLGAMFEGGFVLAAGGFVLYGAADAIARGGAPQDSTLGLLVMVPVLGLTLLTVTVLRRTARATGSLVLKADALHYATDIWMNLGVIASLALVRLTGVVVLDPVISAGIALYMIYSAFHIVAEGFHVVMDRSLDAETVARLRTMLAAVPGVQSFHDLRTRGGKIPVVDVHVVVDPEMPARRVHDLHLAIRDGARGVVGGATHVHVHADPAPDAVDPGGAG